MHRCNCSTRALESVVRDFAGISVRQQRAQRFFQHYRTFSTRPSRRQLQTTAGGNVDDDFIPFDLEAAKRKREDLRRNLKKGDGSQEQPAPAERHEGLQDSEEWHAEVEIIRQDAALSGDEDKIADTVALDSRHETGYPTRVTPVPNLDLPAISQHMPSATTGAPLQKTQPSPRMLRKLRRIEEGKFPAQYLEKKRREGEDDGSVADVLEMIDSLEGPSSLKKQKRENVEGKKAKPKKTMDTSQKKPKDKSNAEKTSTASSSRSEKKPQKERWMIEKEASQRKYGEAGWQPRKRLSPDTLEGIRALHASDPATYTAATLSSHFQVTPEAIRRILKSKWQPSAEDTAKRMERWERRGLRKWEEMAAQGMRPPKKWRAMGAGNPNIEKEGTKTSGGRKTQSQRRWDDAVDAADRLPMEGSFADRIL